MISAAAGQQATEVDDERSDRTLTPEAKAVEATLAQHRPEAPFDGRRHTGGKSSGDATARIVSLQPPPYLPRGQGWGFAQKVGQQLKPACPQAGSKNCRPSSAPA
jgi:hypothetical protein